jgi:hypothetical protein
MSKEVISGEATPEQIAGMKQKHGDVFEVTVISTDGIQHKGYLRKPRRQELSYATKVALSNPLGFNESILKACWLAGDDAIKTDDALFMGVSGQMAEIIEVAEASIKKL